MKEKEIEGVREGGREGVGEREREKVSERECERQTRTIGPFCLEQEWYERE